MTWPSSSDVAPNTAPWIAASARRVFEHGLGLRPVQMLLGPWYLYHQLPGAPDDDDPDEVGSRAWFLAQHERLNDLRDDE